MVNAVWVRVPSLAPNKDLIIDAMVKSLFFCLFSCLRVKPRFIPHGNAVRIIYGQENVGKFCLPTGYNDRDNRVTFCLCHIFYLHNRVANTF